MNTLARLGFFAALATCFVASDLHAQSDRGLVTLVEGGVTYAPPGSNAFQPLSAGVYLQLGSTIRTDAKGKAVVALVPGSAVRVSPGSTIVLRAMTPPTSDQGAQVRLSLRSGSMSALVDKNQAIKPDFRIETPQGTAAARGTFYSVSVKDGKTFAAVKEGQVQVQLFGEEKDE